MTDHAAQVRDAHNRAMEALAADVHPYAHGAIREWEKAMDAALDALVAERDEAQRKAASYLAQLSDMDLLRAAAEARVTELEAALTVYVEVAAARAAIEALEQIELGKLTNPGWNAGTK